MKLPVFFSALFLFISARAEPLVKSLPYLTTGNGLISAVYHDGRDQVEYVFPHIFDAVDSGRFVRPFLGNLKLNRRVKPTGAVYVQNTQVIQVSYPDFSVFYFASFSRIDKVFYAVIRGTPSLVDSLSFTWDSGEGNLLPGIRLLTVSHEDLSVRLGGALLTGSVRRLLPDGQAETYFCFSLVDSVHTDRGVVDQALNHLSSLEGSFVEAEIAWMNRKLDTAKLPRDLSPEERQVARQSVTFLLMAQVPDQEVYPLSRGQILASLRPGLWHVTWVRDGSFAIQALTRIGFYEEARKGLEFFLKAPPGRYVHYQHSDGRDYGIGVPYQISVCRYYGNGKEESTWVGTPNIEVDNFGLFLTAYSDYVLSANDLAFHRKWSQVVTRLIAGATLASIDQNSLIRPDSGPWEHYLQKPRQYAFTSGVCARGLGLFADVQELAGETPDSCRTGASRLKSGILTHLLTNGMIKGNLNDQLPADYEYFDAGTLELFANGLLADSGLFRSHLAAYDRVLRVPGRERGYMRLNTADPYESQEWVFINLRIATALKHNGRHREARDLIDRITRIAAVNSFTIPEMITNEEQLRKVTEAHLWEEVWCNCIRTRGNEVIGAIPMIGYGAGVYLLSLW
ncbi:MAG: hypothetical protein L6Q77_07215 [Bacteroidetes bacterium]|nr:hypothetical protein [Bacteroidota bacterium]